MPPDQPTPGRLRVQVPESFEALSLEGIRAVRCTGCDQTWRIPPRMDKLTQNAWHFLLEHRYGHWPNRHWPNRRVRFIR